MVFTVWRRHAEVWIRTWKTNLLPPLVEPILYLLGFGFGVGAYINEMGGVSYVEYIAPSILAISMMFGAFFEATYAAFIRMYYQRTWQAIAATPASATDVLVAELAWATTKSVSNATLMTFTILCVGLIVDKTLISLSGAILMPIVAIPIGLMFAGMGLILTSYTPSIDWFNIPFFLFVNPMFILAGTFFPLSEFPPIAQNIAMCLPLTHAAIITRSIAYGNGVDGLAISLIYIFIMAGTMAYLGVTLCRKRIVS
jgi:lipooligosaccharide transport system permease protein|tara:strand:+ start:3938 stop:4702 length:765 start_codon:yes stop_codon:yes gene_type:complete